GAYVYQLTGSFSWIQRNNLMPTDQCWGVAFADFNGDGRLDLVANNVTQRYVYLWLGNGAFSWSYEGTLSPQAYYENLWPGDLNKDGRIDLVGGAWAPAGVQTWLNDYQLPVDHGEGAPLSVTVWPNPASNRVRFMIDN
ncbi:MAG: VCBS repeat-containing protein, partial [candidate division WOR-3 bacterium]